MKTELKDGRGGLRRYKRTACRSYAAFFLPEATVHSRQAWL